MQNDYLIPVIDSGVGNYNIARSDFSDIDTVYLSAGVWYFVTYSGDTIASDTLNGIQALSAEVDENTAYKDTFVNLKSGYINVKDYGAVGDGVTDDRSAIYNAMIAVRDGDIKTLYFPKATYIINSSLNIDGIQGSYNIIGSQSIIDGSGITAINNTIIGLTGDLSANYSLSENTVVGQKYIKSINAVDLKVGDVLRIYSTEVNTRITAGESQGELCRVKNVVGDSISFHTGIYTAYNADSTIINEILSTNINVAGLQIKGANSDTYELTGINISQSQNVNLVNNTITNCKRKGIGVVSVLGGNVSGNYLEGMSEPGMGYGIAVNTSQDIVVNNNIAIGCRMGFASGGSPYGFARNIKVVNNTFNNVLTFGINTHGAVENVDIAGNTIYGPGLYCTGTNINIYDNNIHFQSDNEQGIVIQYLNTGDYIIINNNKIHNLFDKAEVYGIDVSSTDSILNLTNLVISNNVLNNIKYQAIIIGSSTEEMYIDQLSINDNIIENNNYGVFLRNAYPINGDIIGNIISCGNDGIQYASGSSTIFNIKNNYIKMTGSNARPIGIAHQNINELFVENNQLLSTSSVTAGQNALYASDKIFFKNNFIKHSLYGGYIINAVDSLWMDGNVYSNVSGTAVNNANWIAPLWEVSKDSLARSYNLETSGNASVHFGNITNFSTTTTNTDSLYFAANTTYNHTYSGSVQETGTDGDTLVIRVYVETNITNGNNKSFCSATLLHYRVSDSRNFQLYELSATVGKLGTGGFYAASDLEAKQFNLTTIGTCTMSVDFSNDGYYDLIIDNQAAYDTKFTVDIYSYDNVKAIKMFTK